MAYLHGKLEVTSEVRSFPLGQKRKQGRPKKMPHCLTRSPLCVHPTHIQEEDIANTEPEMENVPDDSFTQTEDPLNLLTPRGPAEREEVFSSLNITEHIASC